jgi:peroxiredoxin
MISLLLLFLSIILSSILTRIGAIALELTGLPEEQAAFQSLSASSGVGYTTKESEYILSNPQRRKIVSVLIDLGSAGIITTMATLAGTIISGQSIARSVAAKPVLPWFPLNASQVLLIFVVVFFYLFYKALNTPSVSRVLKEVISFVLLRGKWVKPVSFEEVLINGGGFGIFEIEVTHDNILVGKTIQETKLKEHEITVLSINRIDETLNSPEPSTQIEEGDVVVVFGPVAAIHDQCLDPRIKKSIEETSLQNAEDGLLKTNEPAPHFSLKNQNGKEVQLKDFLGKQNVILVFYPKDKSYFCSIQLKELSDASVRIRELGAEVLAINQESAASHSSFCDKSNIKLPLLTDPKKKVSRAYKALALGGLVIDRSVYIIDKEGRIRYAKRGRPSITKMLTVLREISQPSSKTDQAAKPSNTELNSRFTR